MKVKMVKLAVMRKEKGMTQTELATAIGQQKNSISEYERGTRNPDLNTLLKIASVLDCAVNDLI